MGQAASGRLRRNSQCPPPRSLRWYTASTAVLSGAELAGLYAHGWLSAAAEAGDEARKGGPLTRFERLCDDALTHYLSQGRRAAFGEQPLIGYLYAKESELTAIRIILTGRLAGLDTETIRERLRESYV